MKIKKVGIVICAWNCLDQVERAVKSAVNTCMDSDIVFTILVHDDCSEIEPIKEPFNSWNLPFTNYYCQPQRNGLTIAWNTGITWALQESCDAVVLCNQDILFVQGWLERFAKDIVICEGLSPLSNSPGVHSHKDTLQGQDVRNYVPELRGIDFIPSPDVCKMIMEKIQKNKPIQVKGIKGFFLGFRTDWLYKNRISKNEFYSIKHAYANKGVGGAENEIFNRVGIRPWIATNFYIHHYRKQGDTTGKARQLFRNIGN